MLLRIRLFKCLDFKTFDFVVIYNIVAKNFICIYKIVLGARQGGSLWGPKGRGWGKVEVRGGDGEGQQLCGAGTKIPSFGPVLPRPIAIPRKDPLPLV